MKYNILLFIFFSTLACCKVAEDLTLSKEEYLGNSFKVNGFYYYIHNNEYSYVYYFYRNGTFFDGGAIKEVDLIELEKILRMTPEVGRNLQYRWGLYQVVDSNMKVEKWISTYGIPFRASKIEGTILNDTTLLLPSLTEGIERVETFHFREFSPKPDSTNVFIK